MTAETILTGAILAALGLIGLLALKPSLMASHGGRALAFLGFFGFPIALFAAGLSLEMKAATTTEFCLSCHEMEAYGQSLLIDDAEPLAANHFQNNRVPRENACFTCHTDYTMFGDVQAKMRGLKHVWVHYLGEAPEKLALYSPYQNRECLHCHGDSRAWAESFAHEDDLEGLRAGATSCLESGCHDVAHAVSELADKTLWHPSSGPLSAAPAEVEQQ